jgi:hypothetical protein
MCLPHATLFSFIAKTAFPVAPELVKQLEERHSSGMHPLEVGEKMAVADLLVNGGEGK